MIPTLDCDLRYAAHVERVARINRTGWQTTTSAAARPRPLRLRALLARAGRLGCPIRLVGRGAAVRAGRVLP